MVELVPYRMHVNFLYQINQLAINSHQPLSPSLTQSVGNPTV